MKSSSIWCHIKRLSAWENIECFVALPTLNLWCTFVKMALVMSWGKLFYLPWKTQTTTWEFSWKFSLQILKRWVDASCCFYVYSGYECFEVEIKIWRKSFPRVQCKHIRLLFAVDLQCVWSKFELKTSFRLNCGKFLVLIFLHFCRVWKFPSVCLAISLWKFNCTNKDYNL